MDPKRYRQAQKDDMKFFKEILAIMRTKGVSIPNVMYTFPDYTCWSDASSFGLRGFNHESRHGMELEDSRRTERKSVNQFPRIHSSSSDNNAVTQE